MDPVGTDESKGHIVAAWGREALFCSCINFCSLRQTKISWPLARQNSQGVSLEDWEVGRPKFIRGEVVNAAMRHLTDVRRATRANVSS